MRLCSSRTGDEEGEIFIVGVAVFDILLVRFELRAGVERVSLVAGYSRSIATKRSVSKSIRERERGRDKGRFRQAD